MIERVWPIPGAQVVDFDFDAAEDAWVVVTRRVRTIIEAQSPARRRQSDAACEDWVGYFRNEYDAIDAGIHARLGTVWEHSTTKDAREITAAVPRANARQQRYNEEELARQERERQRQLDAAGT